MIEIVEALDFPATEPTCSTKCYLVQFITFFLIVVL